MAERMPRREAWSYFEHVLTNGKEAVKGELATFDTNSGEVTPGAASTTLLPIGWFDESLTGDGTKKVRVRLFQEANLSWWGNDTAPNDVQAADIGSEVFIKDSKAVTKVSSGNSKAGRVWAVSATNGVLIESGIGVTGPTGGSGSALSSGGVADRAALKAVAAASRFDGQLVLIRTDNSLWRFNSASTATEDEAQDLVLTPDAGTGRWVRADKSFVIKAPIGFATADNAVIETIPTGFVLRLAGMPFWEVTTSFTGGTGSAIGIDASVTGFTTQGDLLGGATGDVEADLTAGIHPGTVGPAIDALSEQQAFVLQAADELHFGRITSAFTAGAGFACFPVIAMTPA